MIMFGSFLPSLGLVGTTKSTQVEGADIVMKSAPIAWDPSGRSALGLGVDSPNTSGLDLAFCFTYAKPCTILMFLSRAALQPDDFENPTISVEVSDVEERRSKAAG
jgi:hypothetical protein